MIERSWWANRQIEWRLPDFERTCSKLRSRLWENVSQYQSKSSWEGLERTSILAYNPFSPILPRQRHQHLILSYQSWHGLPHRTSDHSWWKCEIQRAVFRYPGCCRSWPWAWKAKRAVGASLWQWSIITTGPYNDNASHYHPTAIKWCCRDHVVHSDEKKNFTPASASQR